MLEVRDLSVGYGQVQVLWDVALCVNRGEIVSVLGPNGAGKSTLLRSIVGLVRPIKGSKAYGITYWGKRIDGMPPEDIVSLGIALVTEEKHLFPEMTVLDNLKMGAYIGEARRKRKESLEFVFDLFPRLAERRSQAAKTLSGGERQMLAIGRALMSGPELLMIDEPSIGLQPLLIMKTLEVIKQLRERGVTILMVEQNVFFSLEMSDRAYVLENGRIVMEGSGAELLRHDHIKKAYLAL
jgi:branched-chain amino acid transport system ATP-binding protein